MKEFLDYIIHKFNLHKHLEMQEERETVKGITINETWYYQNRKNEIDAEFDILYEADIKNEIGGSDADGRLEYIKVPYNQSITVLRLDLKINDKEVEIDDFDEFETILINMI